MDCELNRSILHGDIFDKIKEIPTNSIDCIITSPPYFGLRDYKIEGQIGLESNFKNFLQVMQQVMDECRRVLKDSGTVWVNIGDTYNNDKKHYQLKSLFGIPERFYVDCIDNGWIARNHIPWVKTTYKPESAHDRFTHSWESIFFFAKNSKYYFNLDAVREKPIKAVRNIKARDRREGFDQVDLSGEKLDEETANQVNFRTEKRKYSETHHPSGARESMHMIGSGNMNMKTGKTINHSKGKNPGDVFFIQPIPFLEAHHATFPLKLPIKILKCACPPDGIVLDPFLGAGTTALAAEKLGMRWIGIELNEKSVNITKKRLNAFRNNPIGEYTE